ncbi:hypothetical protein AB6A40_007941 [Gnathostoma spinigerum]|uniref:Uncharacterized protein n=1 Tax=Gnathostoma spinigerum TaxID=75299 RepID=A0ABD6EXC3_9BILA
MSERERFEAASWVGLVTILEKKRSVFGPVQYRLLMQYPLKDKFLGTEFSVLSAPSHYCGLDLEVGGEYFLSGSPNDASMINKCSQVKSDVKAWSSDDLPDLRSLQAVDKESMMIVPQI